MKTILVTGATGSIGGVVTDKFIAKINKEIENKKLLSNSGDSNPYIRMLTRAQAFTASIDFAEYDKALKQLNKSHAFMQPNEGKLMFKEQ